MNSFGPGWNTMRSSTITTAAIPSPAVSALAATGSATVREVAVTTASPIAASAAARITRSAIVPVKPWPSQAPKPALFTETSPNGVLMSAPPAYQSTKNIETSSTIPPTAAIISPRLNLPRSINTSLPSASSVGHALQWSYITRTAPRGPP